MHGHTLPHSSPAPKAPRRARTALLLACAATLAASLAEPAAAQQPVRPACTMAVVRSAAGSICGTTDTTTVGGSKAVVPVYRGIPYAKAPVDTLRWKPTRALPVPDTTIRATAFGLACPQGSTPINRAAFSEDCLYLNVWTPSGASRTNPVPVMVFVHGGAFVIGRGSSPMYNGAYLAAADTVVVVTLNYRLGALGFLAAGASGADTVAGNFGLLDQQTALRWVRRNIGAFGGDTAKVTLFGESAGAMSVGFHLFSMPSSDSLFRAAIMESNPFGAVYRTPAVAQRDAGSYMKELCKAAGAGALTCDLEPRKWFFQNYQKVPANQVLQAENTFDTTGIAMRLIRGGLSQGLPWTPVIDGTLVRKQPLLGYATTSMRRKPYIFGFNRDEGVVFGAGAQAKDLTAWQYNAALDPIFGLGGAAVVRNYVNIATGTQPYNAATAASVAEMTKPASAISNLITDMVFKCANLAAADSGSAANQRDAARPPVFGYLFQPPSVPFMLYNGVTQCSAARDMVCHGDELPYVFNTLGWADTAVAGGAPITDADTSLARQMGTAWGNFAKRPTQSPVNGWGSYSTANRTVFSWAGVQNGPMVSVTTGATGASCPLWFNLYPLKAGSVHATAAADALDPPAPPVGAR
jgi:para-nitrobenzyl esterase